MAKMVVNGELLDGGPLPNGTPVIVVTGKDENGHQVISIYSKPSPGDMGRPVTGALILSVFLSTDAARDTGGMLSR